MVRPNLNEFVQELAMSQVEAYRMDFYDVWLEYTLDILNYRNLTVLVDASVA